MCSDDRSISPNAGNPDNREEQVYHDLSLRLSPEEKEMVLQSEASKNLDDLELFARFCKYFRGEHHIEEIMYYANVDRSVLTECIDKFRSILITIQRTDPSISFTDL